MKIKRFSARTMRQALRQVRDEQGADAVILSNRSVDGGVEVVAAVDYDETLIHRAMAEVHTDKPDIASEQEHLVNDEEITDEVPQPAASPTFDRPAFNAFLEAAQTAVTPSPNQSNEPLDLASDPTVMALREDMAGMRSLLEEQLSALVWDKQSRRQPKLARLLRRLTALDMDADVARAVAARAMEEHPANEACGQVLNVLAACLPVAEEDVCVSGGVFAVVGPTGVGKTTSIAKIAARFALAHGRDALALVSTDSFRIGAQEQLATFAQILDVPVHLARDNAELSKVLRGLASKRLVLIDTAGVGQRDRDLAANLERLRCDGVSPKRLLALPANVQGQTMHEVIRRFGDHPLHGAIVTKIDEAASFGAIFSNLIRHRLGMVYLTDGQRVPEDLHSARGKSLWWVREAARRLQEGGQTVDEATMARNFSKVQQHAHA